MPLAFLSSDDSAALLSLVSSLICRSLTSKEQVILSRLSSIYIRVHGLTCACALWQKGEKARGSGVVQIFSCGHSEYIAHMEYIAHASVMSMAARRAGDGRTTIIIIYRLRTFNSSMWGSLRLAPIIYSPPEEVGSVVRSLSVLRARRVYRNVNYFGVIRAIAMARAVVGHRERAVPVACWPSTIYGCSYELSIGLNTSLKTIDGDCW